MLNFNASNLVQVRLFDLGQSRNSCFQSCVGYLDFRQLLPDALIVVIVLLVILRIAFYLNLYIVLFKLIVLPLSEQFFVLIL